MRLRKNTEWKSERVGTVPRVIVEPEAGAAAHLERQVRICIPSDPGVQIAIDEDPKAIDGRDAYWPEPPRGLILSFHLKAGQFITARAANEMSALSVIIEYLTPEAVR